MVLLISRLRQLIDTILLGAVDSDHTHLIISFSHLVVEGFYLPPSDNPVLLNIVHEGEGQEVEITVEGGAENTTVQVQQERGREGEREREGGGGGLRGGE